MSIAIVVGDGRGAWAVASDGRDLENDVIVSENAVKHVNHNNVIVACCGPSEIGDQLLSEVLRLPADKCVCVDDIVIIYKGVVDTGAVKYGENEGRPKWTYLAVCAVFRGDPVIYDICSTGIVHKVYSTVYAIGAGRNQALSAYYATLNCTDQTIAERAESAVNCTKLLVPSCGGVVRVSNLSAANKVSSGKIQCSMSLPEDAYESLVDINLDTGIDVLRRIADGESSVTFDKQETAQYGGGYVISLTFTTFVPSPSVLQPPFKFRGNAGIIASICDDEETHRTSTEVFMKAGAYEVNLK